MAAKHVFLRNEPDLPSRNYERMLQGGNMLGRTNGFFQSGSFGKAESICREKNIAAFATEVRRAACRQTPLQFVMLMPIRVTLWASK